MDLKLLQALATQSANLGFDPICLTGGEPFLFPAHIRAVSDICTQLERALVVQTNGFWAATERRAKRALARTGSITQLGLSVDRAHMEFIPLRYVAHAIEASMSAGISNISVSISYQTKREEESLRKFFERRFPDVVIESWPISKVGRAARDSCFAVECEDYTWQMLPRMCEASTILCPIVTPKGDVHMCYHLVMLLGKSDPLLIGSIVDSPLDDLFKETSSPLYWFIAAFGGGSLGYLLDDTAPKLLSRRYQRVCEFCLAVLSDRKLVASLTKTLSTDVARRRIEETLMKRLLHPRSINDQKREILRVCTGKNCFGNPKYRGLGHFMLNSLVDSGRYKTMKVECQDCLGRCAEGPNVLLADSGTLMTGVTPDDIRSLMSETST